MNKTLSSILIGLSLATIAAASKAYIDVERLKINQLNLFDLVKETREDVKYIRRHIPRRKQ